MEPLTVADVVSEMSRSQGFIMFVSLLVKKENGDVELQHRYLRNQFISEDMKNAFQGFSQLISNDIKQSANELIQSAESIANQSIGSDVQIEQNNKDLGNVGEAT